MHISFDKLQTYFRSSLVFIALLVSGCATKIQVHGKYISPEQISQVRVGEAEKHDVEEQLGSPLSKSAFNDDIWYYGGRKTSKRSFFKPVLIDYKGYAIYFNKRGRVSKIAKLDQCDIIDVDPAKRYTPTAGHEMSFIEQMGTYARRPAGKKGKRGR